MISQYKFPLIVIALMALSLVMFLLGMNRVQTEFDAYKQQQTILAQQQVLKAKQTELENAKRTDAITQSYQADLARLNAALRLRKQSSNSSPVPAASPGSQGINGTATASTGTCEGTEFYQRALKAELMLETWQQWAREQKFPVQ